MQLVQGRGQWSDLVVAMIDLLRMCTAPSATRYNVYA